ncbi:MAG: hypothetical protein RL030_1762 [Pseudomonadota bacterium]
MARSRNIKPGFFANDKLGELPPLARLLFAGLWTISDRDGRTEDRPKRIKAEVLPYDDCDGDALLQSLHDAGFILRYSVADIRVIQVLAWDKHQNPHVKEVPSTLPAPDKHQTSMVLEPCECSPIPALARLIPDSLSLDSLLLIPDSKVATTSLPARPRTASRPAAARFDGSNTEDIRPRAVVQLAQTFDLPSDWGNDALALGWGRAAILRESERFRQYWTVGAGAGGKRSVKGWRQGWSNWLGKAEKMNGGAS